MLKNAHYFFFLFLKQNLEAPVRIATWCCAHSLWINPDKTKLLLLGTPPMPEGFAVSLLGKEILPSPSAKSLRVVVDLHLSFDEHMID